MCFTLQHMAAIEAESPTNRAHRASGPLSGCRGDSPGTDHSCTQTNTHTNKRRLLLAVWCSRPHANGALLSLQAAAEKKQIQLIYVSNRQYHSAGFIHRHITDTVSLTHFSGGIRGMPNLIQTARLCWMPPHKQLFFFASMTRSNGMNSVKAILLDCE